MAWNWCWKYSDRLLTMPRVHMHRTYRFRWLNGELAVTDWPTALHDIVPIFKYRTSWWALSLLTLLLSGQNSEHTRKNSWSPFLKILGSDCLCYLLPKLFIGITLKAKNKWNTKYDQKLHHPSYDEWQISIQDIKEFHILWTQLEFKNLPYR